MHVDFTMHRNPDIPTNWDALLPFEATAPIAVATLENAKMFTEASLAQTLADSNKKSLYLSISNQFHALPEFTLFPGFDPSESDLIVNGRLNHDHARPLAVRDPNELGAEFSLAAMNASPQLLADMCLLIAQLQVEELTPILTDLLPQIPIRQQEIVLTEIRSSPSFGDFAPILAVIKHSPPDTFPQSAISMLRKQMTEPKVRSVIEDKLRTSSERVRPYFASALFHELPRHEFQDSAEEWLTHESDSVAREFFSAMVLRHPDLGRRFHAELYDNVSDEIRLTMIREVKLSTITYLDGNGESLRKAALQNEHPRLKQAAYDELGHLSDFEKGWRIIQKVEKHESNRSFRELAKIILIRHLDILKEEEILKIIHPELISGFPKAETSALNYFFSKDFEKTTALDLIAKHLRDNPSSTYLQKAASAISRNRLSSLNWDVPKNTPQLREILGQAIVLDDIFIRLRTYDFLAEIALLGDTASLDILKLAR